MTRDASETAVFQRLLSGEPPLCHAGGRTSTADTAVGTARKRSATSAARAKHWVGATYAGRQRSIECRPLRSTSRPDGRGAPGPGQRVLARGLVRDVDPDSQVPARALIDADEAVLGRRANDPDRDRPPRDRGDVADCSRARPRRRAAAGRAVCSTPPASPTLLGRERHGSTTTRTSSEHSAMATAPARLGFDVRGRALEARARTVRDRQRIERARPRSADGSPRR